MPWVDHNVGSHEVRSEVLSREDLIAILMARYEAFCLLPPLTQELIDAERILPTAETHGILYYFLLTGTFSDEDYAKSWHRACREAQ